MGTGKLSGQPDKNAVRRVTIQVPSHFNHAMGTRVILHQPGKPLRLVDRL